MVTQAATKPSLTVKRRFKASPAKVFAAWTDPEKVKRWMGPGEVKAVSAESDLRGVEELAGMFVVDGAEQNAVAHTGDEVAAVVAAGERGQRGGRGRYLACLLGFAGREEEQARRMASQLRDELIGAGGGRIAELIFEE